MGDRKSDKISARVRVFYADDRRSRTRSLRSPWRRGTRLDKREWLDSWHDEILTFNLYHSGHFCTKVNWSSLLWTQTFSESCPSDNSFLHRVIYPCPTARLARMKPGSSCFMFSCSTVQRRIVASHCLFRVRNKKIQFTSVDVRVIYQFK